MLRKAEATYLWNKILKARDPKSARRVINEQLRGKRCSRKLPEKLVVQNPTETDMNQANSFLTTIGAKINEGTGYIDDTEELPQYDIASPITEFREPSEDQIQEIIKTLKNGKAPGWDGFISQTLKFNIDSFSPILTHLVALICRHATFPKSLKQATTILIHKNGSTEDLKNYRFISLLSIFSKIVEKYMASIMNWHIELNKILSEIQYGFRRNSGTQDAVHSLQRFILNSPDKKRHENSSGGHVGLYISIR